MRKFILALSLAAAVAAPTLAAASGCEERAEHRRVAGTILGGLAGAVIGNQVSHSGGALIGGIGGAVVGNQLSRTSCDHAYARRRAYEPAVYRNCARCGVHDQAFYDDHGNLVHQQVSDCQ
jgi:uncharacterized protein YcfJ